MVYTGSKCAMSGPQDHPHSLLIQTCKVVRLALESPPHKFTLEPIDKTGAYLPTLDKCLTVTYLQETECSNESH